MCVLASPFWFIKLVLESHFLSAATVLLGGGLSLYCFGWACMRKQKFVAYAAMMGILGVACASQLFAT